MDNHLIRTTAFGTLNYECILDVAASHLGLKLAYLAKVPPLGNLLVWKLHGSCNVLPKMNATGSIWSSLIPCTRVTLMGRWRS